jgi:hypothetical protein
MSFFRRPDYKSETTLFIEQLKKDEPKLVADQRNGLALLWNKLVDRDAWTGYRKAKVAQKPYVYQTSNKEL